MEPYSTFSPAWKPCERIRHTEMRRHATNDVHGIAIWTEMVGGLTHSGNQSLISCSADSVESDPWQTLRPTLEQSVSVSRLKDDGKVGERRIAHVASRGGRPRTGGRPVTSIKCNDSSVEQATFAVAVC